MIMTQHCKTKTVQMRSLIALLLIICCSCGPKLSADWTKDGYKGKKYDKIAVIAITENLAARMAFEDRAVKLFQAEGINAVSGLEYFPQNMTESDKEPANLLKIVAANKIDAIITMSVVDSKESMRYQSGDKYLVAEADDFSSFEPYYHKTIKTVSSPGYYAPGKTFLVEAALHDLTGNFESKAQSLVWSGQSDLVNPSSPESAALNFSRKMVDQIVKKGIIKSK